MSYKFASQDLLAVPGKMALDEMAFLAALARRVPKGGRIVEVGCFYGRSTNAMARANPGACITSIDTFEDVEWTRRYQRRFKDVPVFSQSAFEHYTADLPNVEAIAGFSPDVVQDWSEPVDMYFEDAIHGNPGLKHNLDFWFDKVKPGGIVCGHDYAHRFCDIKSEIDGWAKLWGTQVRIVGSLWAMRKPIPGEDPALSWAGLSPVLTHQPTVIVNGMARKSGPFRAQSDYWAGPLLDKDPLHWIMLRPQDPSYDLQLEYRLGHPIHGTCDWVPMGQKARLLQDQRDQPFTRLAIRLRPGSDVKGRILAYRVAARGRYSETGISGWAMNGDWARLPFEKAPICAITVSLLDAAPVTINDTLPLSWSHRVQKHLMSPGKHALKRSIFRNILR